VNTRIRRCPPSRLSLSFYTVLHSFSLVHYMCLYLYRWRIPRRFKDCREPLARPCITILGSTGKREFLQLLDSLRQSISRLRVHVFVLAFQITLLQVTGSRTQTWRLVDILSRTPRVYQSSKPTRETMSTLHRLVWGRCMHDDTSDSASTASLHIWQVLLMDTSSLADGG
jgi:hypothetical protein